MRSISNAQIEHNLRKNHLCKEEKIKLAIYFTKFHCLNVCVRERKRETECLWFYVCSNRKNWQITTAMMLISSEEHIYHTELLFIFVTNDRNIHRLSNVIIELVWHFYRREVWTEQSDSHKNVVNQHIGHKEWYSHSIVIGIFICIPSTLKQNRLRKRFFC